MYLRPIFTMYQLLLCPLKCRMIAKHNSSNRCIVNATLFADRLLKYYKILLLKALKFFASQTNKHIIDFSISIRFLLVLVLVRVLDMRSWCSLLITCKSPFSSLYGLKLIYLKIYTKSTIFFHVWTVSERNIFVHWHPGDQ